MPSIQREFFETTVTIQLQIYMDFYLTLVSKSPEASSVFPFIRGKLHQFNLWPKYDETAILQEVFLRTIAKIHEGREITNPAAWTCSVAYRYIRELSRLEGRQSVASDEYLESLAANQDDDRAFLTDQMLRVRTAFKQLSTEERIILSQKVIKKKSWPEIQTFLKERGYGDYTLPTLRQRKKRILERLRGLFHELDR